MPTVVEDDQIVESFLESDTNHWFAEVATPPIKRDALYKCELNVGGILINYEIIVYKRSAQPDETERTVRLSYGSGDSPRFSGPPIERIVNLTGTGPNISSMTWPESDDPIVQKVQQIAKAVKLSSGGSRTVN